MQSALIGLAVLAGSSVAQHDDGHDDYSIMPGDDATGTSMPAPPTQTIVDIAASDDSFSTLVAAVTAADLVDTLSSAGPYSKLIWSM